MGRPIAALFAVLALTLATGSHAQEMYRAGTHYIVLNPVQKTTVPAGKVEVMEVFSYGCPACNSFQPIIQKMKAGLPANAQMVYLPASFVPSEGWPMFQRAFFAAQALGVADRTHEAMYDAVWKTGELSIVDPATRKLKSKLPSIEDAARFYQRAGGVKPEAFLAAAKSFGVDSKMKSADAQVLAMQVPGTPSMIVNGKYRVNADALRSYDELIAVVNFLVAKESAPKQAMAAKPGK